MFFELNAEVFRVLREIESGCYVISCMTPNIIRFIDANTMAEMERVSAPENFIKNSERLIEPTKALSKRMALIQPILDDEACIVDRKRLNMLAKQISNTSKTSKKCIMRLYYSYLGTGAPIAGKVQTKNNPNNLVFDKAIQDHYFSAKRLSLKKVYGLMLAETYTTPNGELVEPYPAWTCFKDYYYRKRYHKMAQKEIARDGIASYQRNSRPILGKQATWKERAGVFQMDATMADIYLVDQYGAKTVIGRPNIYLAVDTVTRLIAGVYVGMEQGETSALSCLVNAAANKVVFCKKYDIDIQPEEWPNTGLPKRIVIDRGSEFFGDRISELCVTYGMEVERLPAFRPDLKGLVEKAFDLLQSEYKPFLSGKGVIEESVQERWSIDYRKQAKLSLRQFTTIVLRCIVYLNNSRVLYDLLPEQADSVPTAAGLWKWCILHGYCDTLDAPLEELYHVALPRERASLTRTGLNFKKLRYINMDYKEEFFMAGKNGSKSVTVAYDMNNTSCVFLIHHGEYIPFYIAPASKSFEDISFAEYEIMKQKMRAKRREQEREETAGRVALIDQMHSIIKESENDNHEI